MNELRNFHPGRFSRTAEVFDFERASLDLLAHFKARLLSVNPRSQS